MPWPSPTFGTTVGISLMIPPKLSHYAAMTNNWIVMSRSGFSPGHAGKRKLASRLPARGAGLRHIEAVYEFDSQDREEQAQELTSWLRVLSVSILIFSSANPENRKHSSQERSVMFDLPLKETKQVRTSRNMR